MSDKLRDALAGDASVVTQAVMSTIAIAPTRIVISPPRWANDGGLRNTSRHPATTAAKAAARSGGTRISLMHPGYEQYRLAGIPIDENGNPLE